MPFSKFQIFLSYIRILRISNFIISFASIFVIIILSDKNFISHPETYLVALAGALIGGAGMIINDYFDYEIDKINKPERPLPAGLITKNSAFKYYVTINIIALLLLIKTNFITFSIAVFSIIIIYFYSYSLKKKFIVGNITVAFMTALSFIYGSSITGNFSKSIYLALVAFIINLAREILKDIEDYNGDKLHNIKSIPILLGKKFSYNLVKLLLLFSIITTFIIFFINNYNYEFLFVMAFGVNLPLVYVISKLSENLAEIKIKHYHNLIKYLMPVGLLAFYLA